MTLAAILGTWVAQKPFRPEEPTSENWFHFCDDGYMAHEFFHEPYGWSRNWYFYELSGPDRISRICLGSYARKFFTKENPQDLRFLREGEILYLNEHPFIRSTGRPMPERFDLLSGIKEIEGAKTESWIQKFKLIDPKEIKQADPSKGFSAPG